MKNYCHCPILPQNYFDALHTRQFGRRGAVKTSPDRGEGITGHHVVGNPDGGRSRREATRRDACSTQCSAVVARANSTDHRTKELPRSPQHTVCAYVRSSIVT